MHFAGRFGLRALGSRDQAFEWAAYLEEAVARWAPRERTDDRDATAGRRWIGTGIACFGTATDSRRDNWTAVVIAEHRDALNSRKVPAFWRNVEPFMQKRSASFAALVVGPIQIAAGVDVGGSVGVLGGRGGTLGGVLAGDRRIAVTAGHVVSSGSKGRLAAQPPHAVDGLGRDIGHVIGWSALRSKHNKCDLGLIELLPDWDDGVRTELKEIGPDDLEGRIVRKAGAATGTTEGWVRLVGTKGIGIRHGKSRKFFDGLYGIESLQKAPFAWFGDSGALIYHTPPDLPSDRDGDGAIGMAVAVSRSSRGSGKPLCWAADSSALSATIDEIIQGSARAKA